MTSHLPATPEAVALAIQDALERNFSVNDVDFQDPRPEPMIGDPSAVRFDLKVGDKIFWVSIEKA